MAKRIKQLKKQTYITKKEKTNKKRKKIGFWLWFSSGLLSLSLILSLFFINPSQILNGVGNLLNQISSSLMGSANSTIGQNDSLNDSLVVSSVSVERTPYKISYTTAESINVSGGQLRITYSNGTSVIIEMTQDMIDQSSLELSETGNKNVNLRIIFGEQILTSSFQIQVNSFNPVPVSINISKPEISLNVGVVTNLDFSVEPFNANDYKVSLTSSDPSIVFINDKGEIFALKEGLVTITIRIGDLVETIQVNVRPQSELSATLLREKSEELFIILNRINPNNYSNQAYQQILDKYNQAILDLYNGIDLDDVLTILNSFSQDTINFIGNTPQINTSNNQSTPRPEPVVGGGGVITSSVSENQITLTWSKATDDETTQQNLVYFVYQSLDQTKLATVTSINENLSNGVTLLNTSGTADIVTLTIDSSVFTNGVTYYFVVVVKDADDNLSIYNSLGVLKTDLTLPTIVSGGNTVITAGTITKNSIVLEWFKAQDDVTSSANLSYEVFQSIASGIDHTTANALVNPNIIQHPNENNKWQLTFSDLPQETTYYFLVIVKDEANNILVYPEISVTTAGPEPVVGGGGVITSSVSENQITLTWSKATDDETTQQNLVYFVYQSLDQTKLATVTSINENLSNGVTLLNTSGTADIVTLTIDSSVFTNGVTYYFVVVVKDADDNLSIYNSLGVLKTDLTLPTIVSGGNTVITAGTITKNSIVLEWFKAQDDVTSSANLSYEVFQSIASGIDHTTANALVNPNIIQHPNENNKWQLTFSDLPQETTYYFLVIVKDEANNILVYPEISVTTLPEAVELNQVNFVIPISSVMDLDMMDGVIDSQYYDDDTDQFITLATTMPLIYTFGAGTSDAVNIILTNANRRDLLNKNFKLVRDIDLKDSAMKFYQNNFSSQGFVPIGVNDTTPSSPFAFKGDLNGSNFKIDNLYINSERSEGGLFVLLNAAKINNLSLTNAEININLTTNLSNWGTLAGRALMTVYDENRNINNINLSGNINVIGKTNYQSLTSLGGLIGSVTTYQLSDIKSSINILGPKVETLNPEASLTSGPAVGSIGGIVGTIGSGVVESLSTIKNSSFEGMIDVHRASRAGGISGIVNGGISLEKVYSIFSLIKVDLVIGNDYSILPVGGITGSLIGAASITDAFADGVITTLANGFIYYRGGLVGNMFDTSKIERGLTSVRLFPGLSLNSTNLNANGVIAGFRGGSTTQIIETYGLKDVNLSINQGFKAFSNSTVDNDLLRNYLELRDQNNYPLSWTTDNSFWVFDSNINNGLPSPSANVANATSISISNISSNIFASESSGNKTFTISTQNIINGKIPTINWYTISSGSLFTSTIPAGITLSSLSNVNSNQSILTLTDSENTVAGIYYFTIKIDNQESAIKELQIVSRVNTTDNPTIINVSSFEEINNIRSNTSPIILNFGGVPYEFIQGQVVRASYKLTNNIILPTGQDRPNFIPLQSFEGVFDGNDKTIENLYIDNNQLENIGFIGQASSGAVIKNLNLKNINYRVIGATSSFPNIGGIAARLNSGSRIENSTVSGVVEFGQRSSNVGGIVGLVSGSNLARSSIIKSSSSVLLTGLITPSSVTVGGIIGLASDFSVEESYYTGMINLETNSFDSIGGLIGRIDKSFNPNQPGNVVIDSYTNTQIQFGGEALIFYKLGGLVGRISGESFTTTITNSYFVSEFSSSNFNDNIGGLFGQKTSSAQIIIDNSYWLKDTLINNFLADDSNQRTLTELETEVNFVEWDSTVIWNIIDGQYPTLRRAKVANELPNVVVGSISNQLITGEPAESTYTVTTSQIIANTPVSIKWYSNLEATTVSAVPNNLLLSGTNIASNGTTLTFGGTAPSAGTYYFRVVANGVYSNVVTLTVSSNQ